MNGISLCTGYGGLDLGVEMALGDIEWLAIAEVDKWAAVVAEKRICANNLGDIKRINWREVMPMDSPVDVLTAGYPRAMPTVLPGGKATR